MGMSLDEWVCRQNIQRFREALKAAAGCERHGQIEHLLSIEERKLSGAPDQCENKSDTPGNSPTSRSP